MLIGLLGKNAILIVEMANQYRKQGMSIFDAAVRGSVSRLRPILMTSFAFICGLIPLVMASGAGALGNRSIGTAAAGGMFIGTFVGIFLVPGLYLISRVGLHILTVIKSAMMKKMKNNNINKTGLIIGAFCLIMVSCKAPSLTPTEKIELPEFYMDRETDSTTISSMSWKTFFQIRYCKVI